MEKILPYKINEKISPIWNTEIIKIKSEYGSNIICKNVFFGFSLCWFYSSNNFFNKDLPIKFNGNSNDFSKCWIKNVWDIISFKLEKRIISENKLEQTRHLYFVLKDKNLSKFAYYDVIETIALIKITLTFFYLKIFIFYFSWIYMNEFIEARIIKWGF